MKKAIAEIFTTADKPVKSQSTLKNYTGHLDRLCRFNETTPLKLFKSKNAKDDILKYINTRKSASTKNQVCCAVKKLAEILDNKDFVKFGEKEVAKTIAIRKGKKEKLKIAKKKDGADEYGKTHYIEVDTWKPEPKKVEPVEDDLPF